MIPPIIIKKVIIKLSVGSIIVPIKGVILRRRPVLIRDGNLDERLVNWEWADVAMCPVAVGRRYEEPPVHRHRLIQHGLVHIAVFRPARGVVVPRQLQNLRRRRVPPHRVQHHQRVRHRIALIDIHMLWKIPSIPFVKATVSMTSRNVLLSDHARQPLHLQRSGGIMVYALIKISHASHIVETHPYCKRSSGSVRRIWHIEHAVLVVPFRIIIVRAAPVYGVVYLC